MRLKSLPRHQASFVDYLYTHCPVGDSTECVRVTENVRRKCAHSMGEHICNIFLNIKKTYIFQSRNFILYGNIMHRLKFMCLKFGAGTKKKHGSYSRFSHAPFLCHPVFTKFFMKQTTNSVEINEDLF